MCCLRFLFRWAWTFLQHTHLFNLRVFLCSHPQGGRRNWKRRWVVVRATQFIAWYGSDAATETKGSMALHGAQVKALVAIVQLLLLLLLY